MTDIGAALDRFRATKKKVLAFANASPAKNKVIVLDSCHSGVAGNPAAAEALAPLSLHRLDHGEPAFMKRGR